MRTVNDARALFAAVRTIIRQIDARVPISDIPGMYLSGEALRDLLIVPSFDLPTIASVVVGLAIVTLITCLLAAMRITQTEPAQLLREAHKHRGQAS